MDNFDLRKYLAESKLLNEHLGEETETLSEDSVNEEEVKEEFWAVERPNGEVVDYFKSEKEAQAWIRKKDPEGIVDYHTRQIEETETLSEDSVNEEELEEMARIATFYKLTDDAEEKIEAMPENKQKSTRYQRVIRHLIDNEKSTLKDIADEQFGTADTAAVSPIMRDLLEYGVVEKAGLVTPKQEKPVGDGTRGRKMTEVGYVKNAMMKYRDGNFDYTDEEREALSSFIKKISATLKKGKK